MASWVDLPLELKRFIFDALEDGRSQQQQQQPQTGRKRRGPYVLSPLATVSAEWRDAIEAITFKGLVIRTTEVNAFESYFLNNPRRQAALRHVCLVSELPRYPSRLSCIAETEEEQDANDGVFSDTLWHFFMALSAWDADALLRDYKAPGLILELAARSSSDKPQLFGERGISENGESRFFDSQLDLNIAAMHEPHGRIGLPEVPVVTTLCILRQNHRFITAHSLLHIMHSLPRLEYVDLELWHHFSDEAQRQADQDLAVNMALWPATPKKLTLFRFSDAFSMEEELWGHDIKYPFFARRVLEFSQHLEELAVADFIDADHFFEPFYTPQRRLRMPYWENLRLLSMTSTTICSSQPEESLQKLLQAAGLAAKRMPALHLLEIFNAEPHEGGLFRYLTDIDSASILWQSMWEYRIPDSVRQAWTAAARQSHNRLKLVVEPELVLDVYHGPAWFIHTYLMTRPSLLHPLSSRLMMGDLDYKTTYRKLVRGLPQQSRRAREIEEVKNKLRFLTGELERLQNLDDNAEKMDVDERLYDHVFPSDPDAMDQDSDDPQARIEIMYQDNSEGEENQPEADDDEAWETE